MSDEVELTCIGDSAHISDLGLKLSRGSKIWMSLTAIGKSKDLVEAKRLGLVTVRVLKARIIKANTLSATVTAPTQSRGQQISAIPYTPISAVLPTPTVKVSSAPETAPNGQISELIREIRGLREDVRGQKQSVETQSIHQMVSALAATIRDSFQGVHFEGATQTSPSLPEEVYIPSGIVTGVKAEITTLNEISESTSSLDDAQGALKKARRNRSKS